MKKHAAPVIAAILLLLPVLYVGSYLALATPRGTFVEAWDGFGGVQSFKYRYGGNRTATLFCPLEQIDRKVRPGAWQAKLFPLGNQHRLPKQSMEANGVGFPLNVRQAHLIVHYSDVRTCS